MNVQHERIVELCTELRLGALAAPYPALAQQGAKQQLSFTDFLETLLSAERESQRVRTREMFAWVAGFPAIKTLGRRRRFQFVSFAGGRVKWPRPGLELARVRSSIGTPASFAGRQLGRLLAHPAIFLFVEASES